MPTPRSHIIDESVTPWYHCISRCVRGAQLCGEGREHRKGWLVKRLRWLLEIFAIDCGGFAAMDNHLHLLLRLDSQRAASWSREEVARRWLTLFPIRDAHGRPLPVTEERVSRLAEDVDWVAKMRDRLRSLSWFMKCLKEPLARMANAEDGCTGAFWEGRFKSIPVRSEEALLAVAAYIDLNPFAAGASSAPETSEHTSLRERLDHCRAQGAEATLRDDLSTRTDDPRQEAGLWLLPLNDRRADGKGRAGLVAGFTLSCHLRLVDAASRAIREGKASVPTDAASIFNRLGLESSHWLESLATLRRLPNRRRIPSCLGPRRSPASPPRRRFHPLHSPPAAGFSVAP